MEKGKPHGYRFSRREILGLLATAGAAAVAGCGGGGTSAAATNTPAPTPTGTGSPAPTNTTARTLTPTTAATATAPAAATATPSASATPAPATPSASPSATQAASGTPTASPTPSTLACVVRPQQTEGPYFVDELLDRSDIRSDPSDGSVREGVLLQLAFRIARVDGNACTALAGATVDVWHCDALGIYSDVSDTMFNTVGQMFLRGYQVTDANGDVQFTTVYPGWYLGRTVHIHFKIRAVVAGQSYEFTSQLYFDDALTDLVHTQDPYASKGERTTRNDDDGIFQGGGDQLLLAPTAAGQGYAATFDIGLQIDS